MTEQGRTGVLGRRGFLGAAAALAGGAGAARAAGTPKLRIGLLHTLSPAPLYIAMGQGDFGKQGVAVEFRFFQAAQPIAAAAVAGDIDLGLTALTGGFFSLAGRGALRVIGGGIHEEKGYPGTAILVSDKAYRAGLTTPAKLGGHSFALTQYGSSFHYMLGRLAQAEHFDLKSMTLRPVQSVGNMLAAVKTGQVDATMAIASMARQVAQAGGAHIIGWVGDIAPYQLTAVFAPERVIRAQPDALHRFARAYQAGIAFYRDAFFRRQPDGKPEYGPKTEQAIALIRRYVFTSDPDAAQKIKEGVSYYPAEGALDVADVARQLQWFQSQGLVKGDVKPSQVIDTGFFPTSPA